MRLYPTTLILLLLTLLLCWSCEEKPTVDKTPVSSEEDRGTLGESEVRKGNTYKGDDYVNTDRIIWQKPDVVINLLGDLADKTVIDIGVGTGFFSLRLTPKAKKVIAADIVPFYLHMVDSIKMIELPEEHQDKLETRLVEREDPKLEEGEADIAMIVNTYVGMENRVEYLRTLNEGIAEGGIIMIIDWKKKRIPQDLKIAPQQSSRIPLYVVEEELYQAGYKRVRTYDSVLDYQYIVTAEK